MMSIRFPPELTCIPVIVMCLGSNFERFKVWMSTDCIEWIKAGQPLSLLQSGVLSSEGYWTSCGCLLYMHVQQRMFH